VRPLAALGFVLLVGCAPHGPVAAGFYVDPVLGDPANDGSAEHPWKSLQDVLDDGLIESQGWDTLPYTDAGELVPKNPGAPVKAGDTIWLRSGYYGDLDITGYYNEADVTIAAADGEEPRFRSITVRSGSHWVLRGLHVSPEYAPTYEPTSLIRLEEHNWQGPISDITVEDCEGRSVADASSWSASDWDTLACDAIRVDGERMTVRGNTFRNVDFGISVGASHSLIERNLVENFSGDGMRGLGDYTVFEANTVKNCYDVNENHDDGFQSWSLGPDGVGSGEVVGITLRGNTIINYEDPNQPHRGTLQGIGCFDGTFVDWVIENNVVIVDHWHGITLLGARNCRIVNNTVYDPNGEDGAGPAWVLIGAHKDETASTGCLIRNNLAATINVPEGQDVIADHNLTFDDPLALFLDPSGLDLRLRPDAEAVDAGSADQAPAIDILGVRRPRGGGVDIGAYER